MKIDEAFKVILKKSSSRRSIDRAANVDGFDCATDGHRLLAIRGNSAGANPDFPNVAKAWLSEPVQGDRIAFADLVEFIGEYPKPKRCDDCMGCGAIRRECNHCEESHQCKCDCDDGYLFIEKRPAWIGVAVINANLLADILPHLDAENVQVFVRGPKERVSVYADNWRIEVMPLMNGGEYQTAPRLRLGEVTK